MYDDVLWTTCLFCPSEQLAQGTRTVNAYVLVIGLDVLGTNGKIDGLVQTPGGVGPSDTAQWQDGVARIFLNFFISS